MLCMYRVRRTENTFSYIRNEIKELRTIFMSSRQFQKLLLTYYTVVINLLTGDSEPPAKF